VVLFSLSVCGVLCLHHFLVLWDGSSVSAFFSQYAFASNAAVNVD
jgi:hypothetical protein